MFHLELGRVLWMKTMARFYEADAFTSGQPPVKTKPRGDVEGDAPRVTRVCSSYIA